jgi:hypothetical protein
MFFRKDIVVTLKILYTSRIGFIKRKTVAYFFCSKLQISWRQSSFALTWIQICNYENTLV